MSTSSQPASNNRLVTSILVAAAAGLLLLLTIVLPAEYGVDPLGTGQLLGLNAINAEPTRTIEISDVIGGNEQLTEVEIPDFGDPVPLPNPAVHQDETIPSQTRTLQIPIGPEQETEIKTVLGEGKVILYSWEVDQGDIYSDFHGHAPEFGPEFFVRYEEHQEGSGNDGSLVAPFSGEHGWYWLNYNEFPVIVTLTVNGYFDDIIDYGIF
ncbi:MAG: hypothetical protein VX690_10145 [Pseudomonadota bacterium]|nr:hypothetical protein [Pseudomonadota bacterium]